MRQEGALIGRDADAGKRCVHLLVQRMQRLVRRHPGPDRVGEAAPLEMADAVERDLERRLVDRAQSGVDVAGEMAVDLADEAQGEVKLVLALPAGAADPAHGGEQRRADRPRRPDGDEQAVHGPAIASPPRPVNPVSGFP